MQYSKKEKEMQTKIVALAAAAASVLLFSAGAERNDPEIYSERRQTEICDPIQPEDETLSDPLVYVGEYYITGYDSCLACCGKTDGITASGTVATVGRTCASIAFPPGTVLSIDGLGTYIVEDTGPACGGIIDIYCADHDACYEITGYRSVWAV